MPDGSISVGVAGWSYPDWDGFVYPPGLKDKLTFIAPYFDCIEINSSFYRPPGAKVAASWAAKTADLTDFYFTAKIHQDVTHKQKIEPETTKAFHEGLAPLIEAKKLRHLLAQFKYDFTDTALNRDHLKKIAEDYADMSNLTLELRHNSWQSDEAVEFLHTIAVSVACLDYPLSKSAFNLWTSNIGEHGYLRLHGRNYDAWFSKDSGRDETYNYLYPEAEVTQIAKRAGDIARISKSLTLIANNHYQGKEAVNALQLKAALSGKNVRVPPLLAEKYPDLKKIAVEENV